MFINQKEVAGEIQLVVMIEKNIIGIDSEKAKERVPKTVVFLILLHGYPEIPPNMPKLESKKWIKINFGRYVTLFK